MKLLRTWLSTGVILALATGYGWSQWAFFHGTALEYSQAVDTPLVKALALAALVGAVALACFPERNEAGS